MNINEFLRTSVFLTIFLCALLISFTYLECQTLGKLKTVIFLENDTTDDLHRIFNVTDFKYLISKSECGRNGSIPIFVNLVHSSPAYYDRRSGIRKTWAHSDPRTITYFLMGMVQSPSLQKRINEEDEQFHDIIQGNFVDTYHNLTYKHTMALKWFSDNCPHVKYLLKADDDVFVNVPAVHEYLLKNKQDTKFILGQINGPAVARNGKWKVTPEEFIDDEFPKYVQGTAVIYSSDFVREAYKKTFTTRFFWIDDVYVTGMIRMQLNVKLESNLPLKLRGITLQKILSGENTTLPNPMFLVTEHARSKDDMIKLWEVTKPYRKANPYKMS